MLEFELENINLTPQAIQGDYFLFVFFFFSAILGASNLDPASRISD